MLKFVWEISSKGAWRPQLFHGEMPREMTARENAHRYKVHEIKPADLYHVEQAAPALGQSILDYMAALFPAPAPEPREIKLRIETETTQETTNVA